MAHYQWLLNYTGYAAAKNVFAAVLDLLLLFVFRSASEKRTTDKIVSTMLPQAKHAMACSSQ
jgi:hypothetical protein